MTILYTCQGKEGARSAVNGSEISRESRGRLFCSAETRARRSAAAFPCSFGGQTLLLKRRRDLIGKGPSGAKRASSTPAFTSGSLQRRTSGRRVQRDDRRRDQAPAVTNTPTDVLTLKRYVGL